MLTSQPSIPSTPAPTTLLPPAGNTTPTQNNTAPPSSTSSFPPSNSIRTNAKNKRSVIPASQDEVQIEFLKIQLGAAKAKIVGLDQKVKNYEMTTTILNERLKTITDKMNDDIYKQHFPQAASSAPISSGTSPGPISETTQSLILAIDQFTTIVSSSISSLSSEIKKLGSLPFRTFSSQVDTTNSDDPKSPPPSSAATADALDLSSPDDSVLTIDDLSETIPAQSPHLN